MALIFLTMARLRLPFDMHFTQKTYYFQKIVTSPFLGQKLQMTHQNVRKKKGFYPIIITCLLYLLFLKKMALVFLTMARLRLPFDMHFTQKTYYFQKIVTSPFLGQKLQMTHQNVRKKEGFYPISITCLLCLLFLKKMATLEKNGKNGLFQCWFRNPGEILNLLINFATRTEKKVSTSRKQTLNNTSCPFVEFHS